MREYVRQQRAAKNGSSAANTPKTAQPSPKPAVKSPLNSNASPVVITVAVTGDVAQKSRVNVPISPKEQIDQIISSYAAGARMVHVHVRDENGKPTWDPKKYAEVLDGTRKYCPDMLLQFTTGNYAPTLEDRMKCLDLRPEMASLTPGSVNFKASRPGKDTAKHYYNTHEEIEGLSKRMLDLDIKPDVAIFDVSMIYATADLVKRNLISLPVRLMFVVGGHMALEARKPLIEFMLSESKHAFGEGNFTWTAVGVGWNNPSVMQWTLELGGHPRTGIEDTMMVKRGVFAKDNAELVKSVAELCLEHGRSIATPEEARAILGIKPKQSSKSKTQQQQATA
jgi:3-keto-5-aminohexanoate cleavage enzyme